MKKLLLFTAIFLFSYVEIVAQPCTGCGGTTNTGGNSSAIGTNTVSTGNSSFASGFGSEATAGFATAMGFYAKATYTKGIALGSAVKASGDKSVVIGSGEWNADIYLENNIPRSLMIGFRSKYPTLFVSESPQSAWYDKTGRVGIGNITQPEAKLHIKADAGEAATVFIQPNSWSGTEQANIWLGNSGHGITASFRDGLLFHTQKNYLFNDGNVGIGTGEVPPETKLDVAGTVKMAGMRLNQGAQAGFVLTCSDINGQAQWKDPTAVIPQTWVKTEDDDIYYDKGRVSINTAVTPTARDMFLTVKGNQIIYGPNAGLFFGDDENSISGYGKYGIEHQNGGLNFWIPWQGIRGKEDRFMNYVLFLKDDGKVGIGTEDPKKKLDVNGTVLFHNNDDQYLSVGNRQVVFGSENFDVNTFVNGKIWANEIEVTTDRWSDYVFEDDYLLIPIKEVETFIKANKHLPGVPSEKEVIKEGVNLGDMDAVLLKKIEELTLYVIEQENNISILKNEIKLLKKKIK